MQAGPRRRVRHGMCTANWTAGEYDYEGPSRTAGGLLEEWQLKESNFIF